MAVELQWKEEMHSYIRHNIAPISIAYTAQQLYDALLSQLLTSCGGVLPTTHEFISVAKLLQYKDSFCADFSTGALQHGDQLSRRPLILCGFLDVNVSSGSVVLKDLSGEIVCEVCATVDDISCCVLLLKWTFIYVDSNKCGSYLEVQNLHPLFKKAYPPYSTTPLVQCFTQKMKKKRFSVHGQVKMVGQICRTVTGPGNFFTVQLNDPMNPETAVGLVVQSPHLMHTASLLQIGQCYQFTCVREMVMNKDSSTIRVLSCSEEAEIRLCQCLDWNLQCSVSKRSRPNESLTDLSLEEGFEQLPGAALTFYKGKVSRCLLPEAGVYEMEGGVRLYMTHLLCPNLCRGIREGALLELHNIHVMHRTLTHSSIYCCRVSTIRVVQFSQLSSGFTPFSSCANKVTSLVMSLSAKDMVWLMEGLLAFKEKILTNGRWDLRTSLKVVQALSKRCVPHKAVKSYFLMEKPHKCPAMEDIDMTRQWVGPEVWSIQTFIDHITTVVERNDFHWLSGPCESEDQAEGPYQASLRSSAKWKHGTVDWPSDVLLVGCLQGNCRSGQLEFVDSTGALLVALPAVFSHTAATDDDFTTTIPMTTLTARAPPHLSNILGSYIGINNCKVVYERIERLGCVCVNVIYLCVSGVNDLTLYTSNVRGPAVVCQHHTATSNIPAISYYIRVTAKGSVRLHHPDGTVQFVAHVMLHEDLSAVRDSDVPCPGNGGPFTILPMTAVLRFTGPLVRWHCALYHKCLYSLTSAAPCLPTSQMLTENPYIIVCENMMFEFLGVSSSVPPSILDITDVMSHVLIPSPYNATLPRPSYSLGSDTTLASSFHHRLVSFKCVIKEHTYRFGQDFCSTFIERSSIPESVFRSQVLALKVQSLMSCGTMMVYCDLKGTNPTLIGLVPGSMVTFYNIQLRTSKVGNVYAMSVALSDIEITSFGVDLHANHSAAGQLHSSLVPSFRDVPNVLLYDLNESYTQGSLSQCIVCINGVFTSVQHISVQLKCSACLSLFINNHCSNVCCMEKKPVLRTCARLIIDDGSGEGYVYCYDDLVTAAIKIPPLEWSNLLEVLKSCGKAYYSRQQNSLWNDVHVPMLETKAHLKLTEIVQKWFILRRVSVCCQPFVSTADRREHTLGHRTYNVKVRGVDYSTAAPPRLQLRALSLSNVNAVSECHKLHCKIK